MQAKGFKSRGFSCPPRAGLSLVPRVVPGNGRDVLLAIELVADQVAVSGCLLVVKARSDRNDR
jgi:hypothetical protein